MFLNYNRLSGTIPYALGSLGIYDLDLSFNNLVGTIPSSLGSCAYLDVTRNQLTGPIPPVLHYCEVGGWGPRVGGFGFEVGSKASGAGV